MSTARIQDVARRAEVSPGTVSNFLNYPEKVAPETGARIQRAIRDLGYVGNSAARTLRVGASRTVGQLAYEVDNPFFSGVAAGVEDRAAAAGYSVILANSAGSPSREQGYLDLFESQRVAGVLLAPVGDATDAVTRARSRGIPVVLVDEAAGSELCSSVAVDDVAGGRLAVEHLVSIGRRRVAFVGGPLGLTAVRQRLDGARAAAGAAGVRLEVVEVAERTIRRGREVGRMLRAQSAESRPDAVFAANDLLAVGIEHGLLSGGGLRVPDDVAIVGYDDIEFAREALVPLSTVRRPAALIGSTAMELLLRGLERAPEREDHSNVTFTPSFVVRASTVPT